MMTEPLFVAIPVLPAVRALIEKRRPARFAIVEDTLPIAGLVAAAHGARAMIVSARERLDAAVIAALPGSVRVVATYSVGFDHIDIGAAAARGIAVVNTPDVLTDAVAETAMLLMLGAARRATESIALIREGRWTGWTPTQLPGIEITGRRLGIYGMGRIGRRIARRAAGFEMEIHYHGRRRLDPALEAGAIWHGDEAAFLRACDVLVLACAATPETVGFLDARRLAALPAQAIIVNIARGSVVVDAALIAALRSGAIAAAGLDVFNDEPRIDPGYLTLPNAFLLPHIGSSTVTARLAMASILLDALDQLDRGEVPATLLTPPA